jgi:ankyrin repeat protein
MAVQQLLVRDNFKADSKDEEGWTPLSWAATNGYEDVIQQLLKRQHCKEQLERIVKKGVLLLLEYGTNIDVEDKNGESAVDMALNWG